MDRLVFYLSLVWLAIGFALLVWGHASSLVWKFRHRNQVVERDIHGGNSPLMASLFCFMWPLIVLVWLYEKMQHKK